MTFQIFTMSSLSETNDRKMESQTQVNSTCNFVTFLSKINYTVIEISHVYLKANMLPCSIQISQFIVAAKSYFSYVIKCPNVGFGNDTLSQFKYYRWKQMRKLKVKIT